MQTLINLSVFSTVSTPSGTPGIPRPRVLLLQSLQRISFLSTTGEEQDSSLTAWGSGEELRV